MHDTFTLRQSANSLWIPLSVYYILGTHRRIAHNVLASEEGLKWAAHCFSDNPSVLPLPHVNTSGAIAWVSKLSTSVFIIYIL